MNTYAILAKLAETFRGLAAQSTEIMVSKEQISITQNTHTVTIRINGDLLDICLWVGTEAGLFMGSTPAAIVSPEEKAAADIENWCRFILGGISALRTEQIHRELYEICDREHSTCNSECPVFRLNDNRIPRSGSECTCFKNGRAMREFLRAKGSFRW